MRFLERFDIFFYFIIRNGEQLTACHEIPRRLRGSG
jgi:hypothetical protein